jgi:flagellar hook assembly protein FlgD
LPEDALVQLSVVNILGQEVTQLVNGREPAGSYTVEWDGTDQNQNKVSGGFYFYRIVVNTKQSRTVLVRKMLLINQ